MGVAAGTLVFMADGSLKPIEDVTIEEEVLSSDGSANFVQSIISCHERMFEVTQLSLHRAHKKKGVNFAPFDMIRLRCSGSQGLMLSNRMVEGMFQDRRNPEERLLEPSVIPASDTTVDSDDTAVDENDGSVPTSDIVVIDEEPDNSDDSGVYDIELNDEEDPEEDINDFRLTERVKDYGSQAVLDSEQEIHDKMQEGLLRAQTEDLAISDEPPLFRMQKSSDAHNMSWPAEVIRIDKLHEPIRQKARIQLSAVNKQISIMRAQLESLFNKPISDRELGAMAWLLGFWLGDGYRRGSIFALNKEDHDVNSTLKRYGEIWGLSMRMINCTENLGTTAYLFIKPGKVRLLTTGNPFWNVVKNLEFIVDKKKNFPKKYSYDEPLVRESLIAGLMDSDGYSDKRPFSYISILSVYNPIKDGAIAMCRSLGLNISISFIPAHISREGWNIQDTYNIVITPGFNFEVFKSLLSRSGCIRKATVKGAFPEIYGIDPFLRRDPIAINNPLYSFECTDTGRYERSYDLRVSGNNTYLTEHQIILTSTKQEAYFCCSCKCSLDKWAPAPWNGNLTPSSQVIKMCQKCYSTFRVSRTMCSNKECLAVVTKAEREISLKQGSIKSFLDDGTPTIGFPCLKCDGTVVIDNRREDLYNQSRKKGHCNSCKTDTSMAWYNDKVYFGKRICHNCDHYQRFSWYRCQNPDCTFIHNRGNVKTIKKKYREESGVSPSLTSALKCLKCEGIVIQDTTKRLRKTVRVKTPGNCISCGRTSEVSWHRLPWSKLDKNRICDSCHARYKRTATRCLDNKCNYIPSKSELHKTEVLPLVKGNLPDGLQVECFPCVKCKNVTYRDPDVKPWQRLEAKPGQKCYGCHNDFKSSPKLVPWDKMNPERICAGCAFRFRTYRAHCTKTSCSWIPCKAELDGIKATALAKNTTDLICIKCDSILELFPAK